LRGGDPSRPVLRRPTTNFTRPRTRSSNPVPSSRESANFRFLARCDCGQSFAGHDIEFAEDSSLEGDGFEPSAFCPESSVSATFRASVAANLHPYNAQFCTPASTEIPQNRAAASWRKCPRMACRNAPWVQASANCQMSRRLLLIVGAAAGQSTSRRVLKQLQKGKADAASRKKINCGEQLASISCALGDFAQGQHVCRRSRAISYICSRLD
jgi:hypothetical protein